VSKRRYLVGGAVALLIAGAVGAYVWYQNETEPTEKRGSAREEFVPTEPVRKPPREDPTPWPTYAYNRARDHVAPYDHRPPYRRLWQIDAHDTLEFPATVGFGRVYVAQQRGLFFALDDETGKVAWRKDTGRCAASSPTLSRGTVYQAYMDFVPCPQARPGADGYLIAWDADTGRKKWKFKAAPIESSPLLVRRTLYFGSWDRKVYAIDARTGRRKWTFEGDEEVNTSAAYWKRRVFIASDAGTLYALNAKTGKLIWSAQSNSSFGSREFFYATPTVAYGRVYIGNTDGTMYVYGAKTGNLLWARPLGTYIYGAAGVWRRKVFVGTYDGKFYALDAATGDTKWQIEAPGAVHAAPTVMDGLVYYATCSTCGSAAQRTVKPGPDGVYAVRARNGRQVWRFPNGKYANPVVADSERIYVTGRSFQYALEPRKAKRRKAKPTRGKRAQRRTRQRR
jgi:outer membrane protein assembly factor BamB